VRSASLAVLALLGCVFTLHWAAAVFIPLLLGVMFSCSLSPAVNRLERWRVPRPLGLASFIGQTMVICFITFFLMASGDSFRRKMVKIAGPTFAGKKITLQALDEITQQIQRHLSVQIATSVLVGVATWLTMLGVGLERAAV
jgi:predicted PurR-regulated permease PerM